MSSRPEVDRADVFSVRMTVPLLRLDGMLTWIGRLLNLVET